MANRKKLSESESFRQYHLSRRTAAPLVVTGVGKPRPLWIQPKDFGKLHVDESAYQRSKITAEVNDMIHALRAGGTIPDPLTVAERPNGTWWVADGFQRLLAHMETQTPLLAMIYPVESLEAEKMLFIAMQEHRRVGAEYMVHAWPGEMADLLRKQDSSPDAQLLNKVNFGRHGNRWSASTLIRCGLIAVNGGVEWPALGEMKKVLARSDMVMRQSGADKRALGIWSMLTAIFDSPKVTTSYVCVSFAMVAGERWKDHVVMPSASSYNRFRRRNWSQVVIAQHAKYRGVLVSAIDKAWR